MIENATLLNKIEEWELIENWATLKRNGNLYWVITWNLDGTPLETFPLTRFDRKTVYNIFKLAGLTDGAADVAMYRMGFGFDYPGKGK